MAQLSERLQTADQALTAFEELIPLAAHDPIRRDAAILRFIFACEACFAAARQYLRETELEERSSPAACIRASRANGLLSEADAEALIALAGDRNRAVHVYSEELAQALTERLPDHAVLLRRWLDALKFAARSR